MGVPAQYVEYVLNSYYDGMKIKDIRETMKLNFGYCPSPTLIHLWIEKYTAMASEMVRDHRPVAGKTWVLNEMILMLYRQKLWTYELIDDKTGYILASSISMQRKPFIRPFLQKIIAITNIIPSVIMVYIPVSRYKELKKGVDYPFVHVPKETYADRHRIGITGNSSLYDTDKYRIKNTHNLRTPETAGKYLTGLFIHHNYFRRNPDLNNRTPAEAALISYPYHSWKALVERSIG